MTGRELGMLGLAAICGFIGGSLANRPQRVEAASNTIRASRFELVDQSGKGIALWGRDQEGQAVLAFLGKGRDHVAAFGVRDDLVPFLNMAGADGKLRLTLRLETGDRPVLVMSDGKWEGRVLLGFLHHDTEPQGDDWGLLFRAPGFLGDLASIGVVLDSAGSRWGWLSVRTKTGKRWSVPE